MYGFHNGAVLARTTGTDDRARCIVLFLVMMTYIANAAYGLQDNRNATVKFIFEIIHDYFRYIRLSIRIFKYTEFDFTFEKTGTRTEGA